MELNSALRYALSGALRQLGARLHSVGTLFVGHGRSVKV
jgi:hypothetical protein